MADVQQNILINIDVESGNVTSQLDTINEKIGGLGKVVNLKSFQSVRAEIAAAREEAVRLALAIDEAEAAGQNVDALSQRYSEVTQRAAQLRDAVEDTNASIANANPDNRLQGLVSIAQGAIVAIQGVAGAFTLLGVDAETANVAIAKLQGIIALTGALESISKVTQAYRDFTAVVNLAALAQRANNAATVAATVVQRLFTGSVVATGAAFTALRVAIAATGIGLLVIGVAAAVKAFIDFKNATNEAAEAQAKLTAEVERAATAYDDEVSAAQRASDLIISDLRARGASQDQIRRAQLTAANRNLQAALRREAELQAQFNRALAIGNQELLTTINNQIRQNLDDITNLRQAARIAENDIIAAQTQAEIDAANERKQAAIRASEEAKQKRIADIRELQQFTEEARQRDIRARQTDLQNEIDTINKRFDRALQLARAYRRDTVELEKLRTQEIAKISQEEVLKGEQFRIDENLKLVEKEVQRLGQTIQQGLRQNQVSRAEVASFIDKEGFEAEITRIFQLGAQLKIRQAEIERDARIESAKRLRFAPTDAEDAARRQEIIEIIKKDYSLAVAQIQDEVDNAQRSLQKGIEITALEVNVAAAEQNVDEVTRILERLLVPFRKIREEFTRTGPNVFGEYLSQLRIISQRQLLNSELAIEALEKEEETLTKRLELQRSNEIALVNITRDRFVKQRELRDKAINDEEAAGAISAIEARSRRLQLQNEEIASLEAFNSARDRVNAAYNQRLLDQTIGFNALEKIELEKQGQLRKTIAEETQKELNLISLTAGERSFARNFLQSEQSAFVQSFDNLLSTTGQYYEALRLQEEAEYSRRLAQAKFNNENTEQVEREHKQRLKAIEQNYQNDVNTINQAAVQARLEIFDNIGSAIGSLAQIFGTATREGKILALADIAIGSATGFIRGLNIAQQTAQGTGPAAAFAFPIFYAQQVAAVLAAVARAKQIIAPVGGGGTGGSTPAPPTPQAISSSVFRLPPEAQNVRVVNQQQGLVRAFITNEDLRTAQERQAFLNKLSSF